MMLFMYGFLFAESLHPPYQNLFGTINLYIGLWMVAFVYKTSVKTNVTKDGLNLQGSNKITFADFGMKSPTAMLGTIKTGQDLTIKFNLNFNL